MGTLKMAMKLKHVSKVVLELPSFAGGLKAPREFLRQLTSARFKASNPKCDISHSISSAVVAPSVAVTFSDKKTVMYDFGGKTCDDIMRDVNLTTTKLQRAEMTKGK